MPLSVGSRLSHYDVTALIGEGGMGQAQAGHRYQAEPPGGQSGRLFGRFERSTRDSESRSIVTNRFLAALIMCSGLLVFESSPFLVETLYGS